ncbi:helix-turn-helix domain-containing protein [Paenibacillus pasadenensis]|uniref:helix-turn-helix domain-containing protein n=1 Tax=Paenibacillus pasadenensis TaxID=217090 RepID=UPI0020422092|nr:helix-turn-helix domain-containing protein [Paenibacillus pasadenensis]MCM3746181.1 helix-turn-helix domain-containing protein [Paenibacillus pasadenensis]
MRQLTDTERKLLRIASNYISRYKYFPSVAVLSKFSGRPEAKVQAALRGLEQEGYIQFDPEIRGASRVLVPREIDMNSTLSKL